MPGYYRGVPVVIVRVVQFYVSPPLSLSSGTSSMSFAFAGRGIWYLSDDVIRPSQSSQTSRVGYEDLDRETLR